MKPTSCFYYKNIRIHVCIVTGHKKETRRATKILECHARFGIRI